MAGINPCSNNGINRSFLNQLRQTNAVGNAGACTQAPGYSMQDAFQPAQQPQQQQQQADSSSSSSGGGFGDFLKGLLEKALPLIQSMIPGLSQIMGLIGK